MKIAGRKVTVIVTNYAKEEVGQIKPATLKLGGTLLPAHSVELAISGIICLMINNQNIVMIQSAQPQNSHAIGVRMNFVTTNTTGWMLDTKQTRVNNTLLAQKILPEFLWFGVKPTNHVVIALQRGHAQFVNKLIIEMFDIHLIKSFI